MERSYSNAPREVEEVKTISIPFSDFIEVPDGTVLHGAVFNKRGKVHDIRLSVERQVGMVRLKYVLERVRSNQEVSKFIHSKAGANNMGDIEIEAGDRLKIEYEPIEDGSIEGIWISYTLEQ